jgi:hypothetical protein
MVDRARVPRDPFRYGSTSAKRERHTAQFSLVSEARRNRNATLHWRLDP